METGMALLFAAGSSSEQDNPYRQCRKLGAVCCIEYLARAVFYIESYRLIADGSLNIDCNRSLVNVVVGQFICLSFLLIPRFQAGMRIELTMAPTLKLKLFLVS